MTQAATWLALRAQVHAWRGMAHETRWKLRHLLARRSSLLLVLAGGLMGVGGGFLIGFWAAGLVIIFEGLGLVVLGLNQDDGEALPLRGAHTVGEVLADERLRG